MPLFSPDPRMVQLRGLSATLHAFPGDDPDAPTRVVVEILKVAISMLTNRVADHDLWCELFALVGEAHPGPHRFDIVLAVLLVLQELDDINHWSMLPWAQVWLNTIAHAEIHPASLVLCTTYKFQALGRALVRLVHASHPAIRISPQALSANHLAPWIIQAQTNVGPLNVLAVGHVVVKEAKQVHLRHLGEGWAIGGDLELRCCRDLQSLGSNMVVFEFLVLDSCHVLKTSLGAVKVAFRIVDVTGTPRLRKSGFIGIQSNVGCYFLKGKSKRLVRVKRGMVTKVITQNPRAALLVPDSLDQLSELNKF